MCGLQIQIEARKRWAVILLVMGLVLIPMAHVALSFGLRRAIEHMNASWCRAIIAVDPWAVRLVDGYGDNALGLAVEKGDVDIVQLLIKHGCNMYHDRGRIGNPCNYAAFYHNKDVVQIFIESGYDLEYVPKTHRGMSCLNMACWGKKAKTVAYLLEQGANPNAVEPLTGETPLIKALWPSGRNSYQGKDQLEIVSALLKHGADPGIRDKSRRTARNWVQEFLRQYPSERDRPESEANVADDFRDTVVPLRKIDQILAPQR